MTANTDVAASVSSPLFETALKALSDQSAVLKETKARIKKLEDDVPMTLEEKLLVLKDLKKEVKEIRGEWERQLLEENAEYGELREKVQECKENIAQAKLDVFTEAANLSRTHGDIDKTLLVQGESFRLQTQKELAVYVNGKVVK